MSVFLDIHRVLKCRELSSEPHSHRILPAVNADNHKDGNDKDEGDTSPGDDIYEHEVELEKTEVDFLRVAFVEGWQVLLGWLDGGVSVRG